METKVQLKNLYLIAVIAIGLIGLGVGSTFAMFNASTSIDDPITFASNLNSTSNLAETIEVVVPAGEDKNVDIVISNTNSESLNYSVWYSPSSNDLVVGSTSSNNSYGPVGTLPTATNFTLTVQLRNNGDTPITVTIGVSSSGSNVILPSGATGVPASELPQAITAAQYITNLYNNATKSTATVNSITYSLAPSVNLMNDRHASMSTDINGGDIRYYGANPNNYVWLGDTYTSDYTILGTITSWGYADKAECINDGNNEADCTEDTVRRTGDKKLWRIVGIFDGRLKLVSNDPISTTNLSWDTSANTTGGNSGTGINQWGESGNYEGSDLMRLLNPGFEGTTVNNSLYWNKGTGTVYTENNNGTTADVSFANTGLTTAEKNMIDTATWYTGAYDNLSYVDAHYTAERGNMGKICTQGTTWCDDTVTRTSIWNGKVGLISASDYGYAANLAQCNQTLDNYYETGCNDTDWLKSNSAYMTMSSRAYSGYAFFVFYVSGDGYLYYGSAHNGSAVRPAVFLKSGVSISEGNGSQSNPFILS